MKLGFWLTLASPAKPLTGVLFLTSPFGVSPASFPRFSRHNDADEDDDVTERAFGHLHAPFSFQNMGRREPPQLLICQTGTHCYRRSDVTQGTHTHCTVPLRRKKEKFVFCFFFSYSNS